MSDANPFAKRRRSSGSFSSACATPGGVVDPRRWSIGAPTHRANAAPPPPSTPASASLSMGRRLSMPAAAFTPATTPGGLRGGASSTFPLSSSSHGRHAAPIDEIEDFGPDEWCKDPIADFDAVDAPRARADDERAAEAEAAYAAYPPPPTTPALTRNAHAITTLLAPHSAASSAHGCSSSARGRSSSGVAHRSSLVAGLTLGATQLGEAAGVRSGWRREGGRKATGVIGALAQRAANELASAEQLLLVRYGILGPNPPHPGAVRGAMRDPELRHRVLRHRALLASAPLVILDCVDDNMEDQLTTGADHHTTGADHHSSIESPSSSGQSVRVVMHKWRYERVCGATGSTRFVVFAPWYEQSTSRAVGATKLLLAPLAEGLPG